MRQMRSTRNTGCSRQVGHAQLVAPPSLSFALATLRGNSALVALRARKRPSFSAGSALRSTLPRRRKSLGSRGKLAGGAASRRRFAKTDPASMVIEFVNGERPTPPTNNLASRRRNTGGTLRNAGTSPSALPGRESLSRGAVTCPVSSLSAGYSGPMGLALSNPLILRPSVPLARRLRSSVAP